MIEAMRLRDPVCVFPGCPRAAERCDADHIQPYVPMDQGGPPGQTSLINLAPLCRRHHRAKTHCESADGHPQRVARRSGAVQSGVGVPV